MSAVSDAGPGRDFLALSRRFLDVLGADGLGSESDQRRFAVDGIEPSWVLLPASASEAESALRAAAEHDLAVVPAGLGARLGIGRPPERLDCVLSTRRMDRIVEHAAADLTVTVEAGATIAAVQDALRPAGQWLPFDPPRPGETTIGGLIAAQAGGPSRQAFGTARESLLGVHAVLADGRRVKSGGRVVKNVAGYDLHKLLVGSFGTLAVLVEATFKLQPLPEASRWLSFGASAVEPLARTASALAASVLGPRILELLVSSEREPRLVAGFVGVAEDVEDAARRAVPPAEAAGARLADEPIDEPSLRAALEEIGAGKELVLRAGVRRSDLARWIDTALARCRDAGLRVAAHTHAGIGVTRLRVDGVSRESAGHSRESARQLIAALRESALAAGGYLVVENAPVEWKRDLDVWGPPLVRISLLKGIKQTFDPGRRLAPGRFVGGI